MEAFIVFYKDGKIIAMADLAQAEALAQQKDLYDEMYWCVPEKVSYDNGSFHYAFER